MLLRQSSRPRVVALGRVPGTTYFADRARHPETEVTPGAVIVRCESSLLYYNVEYVRERAARASSQRPAIACASSSSSSGWFRESISLAPSCSRICCEHSKARGLSSGWLTRTAKCEDRSGEPDSTSRLRNARVRPERRRDARRVARDVGASQSSWRPEVSSASECDGAASNRAARVERAAGLSISVVESSRPAMEPPRPCEIRNAGERQGLRDRR